LARDLDMTLAARDRWTTFRYPWAGIPAFVTPQCSLTPVGGSTGDETSSMNKPTPLGPKTRAALEAIVPLLERIQEDGSVDGDEIASLYAWRTTWRTVARRQPLRWFTDWLDQTLADGEVSPQELNELRDTKASRSTRSGARTTCTGTDARAGGRRSVHRRRRPSRRWTRRRTRPCSTRSAPRSLAPCEVEARPDPSPIAANEAEVDRADRALAGTKLHGDTRLPLSSSASPLYDPQVAAEGAWRRAGVCPVS
jgi:hypothetical protein